MEQIFEDAEYDVKRVEVDNVEKDENNVKITVKITFGPKLKEGIVIETRFREVAKNETLGIGSIHVKLDGKLQQHLSYAVFTRDTLT